MRGMGVGYLYDRELNDSVVAGGGGSKSDSTDHPAVALGVPDPVA